MSLQCGKLRPTNGWDRLVSLATNKFQRLSRLGFVTAPTSLNGGQPNFARCLAVFWAGTLYIHFWGLLPPSGILPRQKFTLHPSLACSYIGSVTARHSSITLRHGIFTWQGGHPVRHWAVELFSLLLKSSLWRYCERWCCDICVFEVPYPTMDLHLISLLAGHQGRIWRTVVDMCEVWQSNIKKRNVTYLWPPSIADADIIFSSCGFFLLLSSSSFPRLISAVADWMSTILPNVVWP